MVMVSNMSGGVYGNILGKHPVVFTVKQATFVQCNTAQHNRTCVLFGLNKYGLFRSGVLPTRQ